MVVHAAERTRSVVRRLICRSGHTKASCSKSPSTAESSLPDETLLSNHASVQGGDTEGTSTSVPG